MEADEEEEQGAGATAGTPASGSSSGGMLSSGGVPISSGSRGTEDGSPNDGEAPALPSTSRWAALGDGSDDEGAAAAAARKKRQKQKQGSSGGQRPLDDWRELLGRPGGGLGGIRASPRGILANSGGGGTAAKKRVRWPDQVRRSACVYGLRACCGRHPAPPQPQLTHRLPVGYRPRLPCAGTGGGGGGASGVHNGRWRRASQVWTGGGAAAAVLHGCAPHSRLLAWVRAWPVCGAQPAFHPSTLPAQVVHVLHGLGPPALLEDGTPGVMPHPGAAPASFAAAAKAEHVTEAGAFRKLLLSRGP